MGHYTSYIHTDKMMYKMRAFNLIGASPDTLIAGKRMLVRIRGYFGESVTPGSPISVSFTPNSATGSILIVPTDAQGNPDPNGTPAPSGTGIVRFEDPMNSTAFQTVEVLVQTTGDAHGIFSATVNGSISIPQCICVNNFGLIADANHDGSLNAGDLPYESAPHAVAMLSVFGLPNHPLPTQRIPCKISVSNDSGWKEFFLAYSKKTTFPKRS